MLSILTSVLLLLPATPQEPAPSCPSQQAVKVVQEAATTSTCDSKASCDSKVSECDAKASACDSEAIASCDSKVADMDFALASITKKLKAQEPECSSKSECSTTLAKTECEEKAPCANTASDYSVVMLQIDDCLEQSGCDSKSECSAPVTATTVAQVAEVTCDSKSDCGTQVTQVAKTECESKSECSTSATTVVQVVEESCSSKTECATQVAKTECESKTECSASAITVAQVVEESCSSKTECATQVKVAEIACDGQQACPSETKAAPAARLVAAESKNTCSEVKAQDCQPAACSETQCETNTVVTLVEEIVEEECNECCEEATECTEAIAVALEQVNECSEVEAACDSATECGEKNIVVALAQEPGCCESSKTAASNVQVAGCEEISIECNEFVTEAGEQQIAVMVRVEGDVENLDAQIADLLRQVEMKQHGKLVQMHKIEGNNVVMEVTSDDCGAEGSCCGSCGDKENTTAKQMIRQRIALTAPEGGQKQHIILQAADGHGRVIETRRPKIMQKRIELGQPHAQHTTDAHGVFEIHAEHGDHDGHGVEHKVEHRLAELEQRLARIESMLERLERRL